MMKCRFCPWEPPALRKDGEPMADAARVQRLESHMGREHREEYRAFRDARYRSYGESIDKERAIRTRAGTYKPFWDVFGRRV